MKIITTKKDKLRIQNFIVYAIKTFYFFLALFLIGFVSYTDIPMLLNDYAGLMPIHLLLFILYGVIMVFIVFIWIVLTFIDFKTELKNDKRK